MAAEIVDTYPHVVREIEFERIPLSDGLHLACRYWLPDDASTHPVPAILEYIPYCTRDGTAARDEAMHPYFAGHGYAAVRVDIRGSGESEGVLLDEYLKLEQDDALEVIAWIAKQPWCDGNVGMMGKSWGGFNGLQVAARRPPALKCIITVFSTDDRYADDVHYVGGCMTTQNPEWGFVMFPALARPPDPALVGDRWRDLWRQRLEAVRPWLITWVEHQRRDAYWKHGSVCENYADIDIPVYAIGGWADAYSNPVPRLMTGLSSPCKALIGPWGHQYMHQVSPGPRMGYMDEALRWWDHWLKGKDTGLLDEPAFRVWVQDSVHPKTCHKERPGYWALESGWPSPGVASTTLHLNDGTLDRTAAAEGRVTVCSPQTTGLCTPFFGNHGTGAEEDPRDQRPDDAASACFDSDVLGETLTIVGAPVVNLDVSSDRENAFLCVRLNEVLPGGESAQVSYGILNLTHRDSHEFPAALQPGVRYQVRVQLNDIAHTFATGSRIRIAVSTAFWPIVWPSPRPATVSLFTGASTLDLPVRHPRATDAAARPLPSPRQSRVHARTQVREARPAHVSFDVDPVTGIHSFVNRSDSGLTRFDRHGWTVGVVTDYRYHIHPRDPVSACVDL
ncbi:MAG: CocE/NonD family hydrolase, partial [Gammaproteobacteria bacterium]|nr:CocE/NonD family hydrolase [Gammaproteobacteria bacterium]